jgi:pentatricopeptide repeat protein
MILGLEKLGDLPLSIHYFETFKKEFETLEGLLLSTMIRIYAKYGDVENTFSLIDRMKELGIMPSSTDYESLIRVLSNSKGNIKEIFQYDFISFS